MFKHHLLAAGDNELCRRLDRRDLCLSNLGARRARESRTLSALPRVLADAAALLLLACHRDMLTEMLVPLFALMTHVTTEARTGYPFLLCWGNAIWATLAFRKDRQMHANGQKPGYALGLIISFSLYGMFANLAVNLLCYGRAPSAFYDETIIPVFVTVTLALMASPFNLFDRIFSSTIPFFIVDSLGLLDAITTMFNFMEEAHATHHKHHFTMLVALMTFLGGGITRHFISEGFVKGCATFDATFAFEAIFISAVAGTYYYAAILKCDGESKCMEATGLYEQLAWVVVARNAYEYLPESKYSHGTSFVKKEMAEKAKGD
eukprot:scaffold154804_cov35-Tisochrysis_lutea.AAC.1